MAEDCSVSITIQQLRDRILADSKRLYELTNPTEQELQALESDLNENPHVYASYLIEQGEGDYLWIALNVLDEREAQEAMEDDPECGNCGRPASEHSGGSDDFSHCPMSDEQRNRVLAEAAKTECCKACHGSGRKVEGDYYAQVNTTCPVCKGTGRVDKQQQR